MTAFLPHDFEMLHRSKMVDGLDVDRPSTMYFFCKDNRMVFIKKSRRFYKIMCSSTCPFEPLYRESCLDVVYYTTDFNSAVEMFESYVSRLLVV